MVLLGAIMMARKKNGILQQAWKVWQAAITDKAAS